MNHSFYIKNAGIVFKITFNDSRLFDVIKKYFRSTKSNGPAEFEIFIKKNYRKKGFKIINNRLIEICFPNGKLTRFKLSRLHYAVIGAAGYFSLTKNIFFLHASAFVKNNKAYIFTAPSGTGKTTIIKAVDKKQVLADDVVIIKKIKKKCFVYSSSFEKTSFQLTKKIPIAAIYFLSQSKNNVIKTLNYLQGFKKLIYNHILFPFGDYRKKINSNEIHRLSTIFKKTKKEKKAVLLLIKLALFIAANVQIYNLFFTKGVNFSKEL